MSLATLARTAARAAARLRADLGIGPAEGVCPFDLAERLGLVVRLLLLPSLEGMYTPDPQATILISTERPAARRRYTCAHELGHHVFGHGTRVDELAQDAAVSWSTEEFVAQRFAAALLMPKLAIDAAYARRGWSVTNATPEMMFIVAQELGVGFTTLIGQLEHTLAYVPPAAANALRRTRLPELRKRLAGFEVAHGLAVVDPHWGRATIDVEVDDIVILPQKARYDGACASLVEGPVRHLVAVAPGIGSVWPDPRRQLISIRVSRRGFTGLARYAHLKEAVDDE